MIEQHRMRDIPDDVLISRPKTPYLFLVIIDKFHTIRFYALFEYWADPFDAKEGKSLNYELRPMYHLSLIPARHLRRYVDDETIAEQPSM
jgi:hypothetical protein